MAESFLPAALKAFRASALRDPSNPMSFYLRALDCLEGGDMEGWRQAIGSALSLPHRTVQQHYCRALTKIQLGDWSGWREYDARLSMPETNSQLSDLVRWIRWTHRVWDGVEDIRDQTILVLPEQGAGDNIQMLRFIPWLGERAGRVIMVVYPRLVPLVQRNFGDRVEIMIDGAVGSLEFDQYVLSMSLPGLAGHLPPFAPLKCPGTRPKLRPRGRALRVGLCWAGNPDYPDDALRSMPAPAMSPLFRRSDIEWHSLQVGNRAGEADAYPTCVRPWPRIVTFGDTADLITELDIVVAVDTATAHLAGCLGTPTLLLLPYRADGRWGLGMTTPWYPTMRIIRQRRPDDWTGVIDEVARFLDGVEANSALEVLRANPDSPAHSTSQVGMATGTQA